MNKQKKFVPNYKRMGIEPEKFPPQRTNPNNGNNMSNGSTVQIDRNRKPFEYDPNIVERPTIDGFDEEDSQEDDQEDGSQYDEVDYDNNQSYNVRQYLDAPKPKKEQKNQEDDYNLSINKLKNNLKEGNYILFVKNNVVCSGVLEYVEGVAFQILLGTNPKYKDINLDDVMILKRMHIKVGVNCEDR